MVGPADLVRCASTPGQCMKVEDRTSRLLKSWTTNPPSSFMPFGRAIDYFNLPAPELPRFT